MLVPTVPRYQLTHRWPPETELLQEDFDQGAEPSSECENGYQPDTGPIVRGIGRSLAQNDSQVLYLSWQENPKSLYPPNPIHGVSFHSSRSIGPRLSENE